MGITILIDKPTIEKDGEGYIAYSDEFELFGSGNTKEGAIKDCKESITASLKALEREGTLLETLKARGIDYHPSNIYLS